MKKFLLALIVIFLTQSISFAVSSYFKSGKNEFDKMNYYNARKFFLKELEQNPNNYESRYYLGLTYSYTNMPEKAKKELQTVIWESNNKELRDNATMELHKITHPERLKGEGDNYFEQAKWGGLPLRWYDMPISVYIEDMPYKDDVKKAFLEWQKVSNGLVSFTFVNGKELAQIDVSVKDKINCRKTPNAVGCAHYGRIVLNRFYHVHIELQEEYPAGVKRSREEIYSTTMHEIGHALGIVGHSDSAYDIMSKGLFPNIKSPTKRDLKTLYLIYDKKFD